MTSLWGLYTDCSIIHSCFFYFDLWT